MAGVINSIRSRAGVVAGIIGFSLLLFILSSVLSNDFNSLFLGDQTLVGKVAGERIDYRAFEAAYNTQINQAQNQRELTDALRQQVLQQTWDQEVNNVLLTKEYDALGITVTDAEVRELLVGNNPSPVILQIPDFKNPQTGAFDPQRVLEIDRLSKDATNPNAAQIAASLAALRQQVIDARIQEKFIALLGAAAFVSTAEARRSLVLDQTTRTFDYLAVNFGAVADSSVQVSDGDFERFYQMNKERFKLDAPEAVLQYVVFSKAPTQADSAAVRAETARLQAEFATTTEDSLFAAQNSDLSEPARYVNELVLDAELREQIKGATPGQVIGPVEAAGALRLLKLVDSRRDTLPDARLSVIVIQPQNGDSLAARALADSLARVATPENFSQLAIQYSMDMQSRFRGGDIGVYNYGQFGPDFDRTLRNAPTGVLRQPVSLPQAQLVVYVAEKSDREVRVASITKEFVATSNTVNAADRSAREFAAKAREVGFDTAARQLNLDIRTSPTITPDARQLPGLEGGRDVASWALLDDTEAGDITETRDAGNAFVVASLRHRYDGEYRPLEAVREDIRAEVVNRKKAEYIRSKLGSTQGKTLQALQQQFGSTAFVGNAQNIAYTAPGVPGIGNDAQVVGAAFGVPLNTVSQPVTGQTGVYVLAPTQETKPAEPTAEALQQARERLQAQRAQQLQSRLYQGLRQAADIRDLRYRFNF